MGKRKTTEQFIAEAKAVHGDKYDYSKVEYKNNKTKVCIICPIHGWFLQVPKDHLDGIGCKKCGVERRAKARRLNTNIFIHKAKKVHGEEYDYSKVEYIGTDDEVCIIDKKYNKEFWQTPHTHLKGNGSPFRRVLNLEEFIKRAKEIHGNKYDYSKVEYVNTETKVCIICPIHGEFWQAPHSHLASCGCPACKDSKLEKEVREYLNDNKIVFESFKKFDWLGKQHLDFYLPKYNIAIECQGMQHFKPIEFFGGSVAFKNRIKRDCKKKELCENNNIKIIYFSDVKDKLPYNSEVVCNIEKLNEKIIEYGNN